MTASAPADIMKTLSIVAGVILIGVTTGVIYLGGSVAPVASSSIPAAPIPAQATDTVLVCPSGPDNTVGGVDLGTANAVTTISPIAPAGTSEQPAATYRGKKVTPGAHLSDASGGTLLTSPLEHAQGLAPAVSTGVVTTVTQTGDLRGLTASSCISPAAVSWIVGGSAQAGSSAQLRLTNPGATTAVAHVSIWGSTGLLQDASASEIAIAAGQTSSILLESSALGDPRLAVRVDSEDAPLAVTLVDESLDGETAAGVDVVTPAASPATDLTIPGVVLVDDAASRPDLMGQNSAATSSDWPLVRILNPSREVATVTVTLRGADGDVVLPGAEALSVDPGAVFDFTLAGVKPGDYAIRIHSTVAVTGAAQLVRAGGEYPQSSRALVHDRAWVAAQSSGAGALSLPRTGLTSRLLVTSTESSGQQSHDVLVTSADGTWSTTLALKAGTTSAVEVPATVSAVWLTTTASGEGERGGGAADSQSSTMTPNTFVAAVVVEASSTAGPQAGGLISVIAPVPGPDAVTARGVRLH